MYGGVDYMDLNYFRHLLVQRPAPCILVAWKRTTLTSDGIRNSGLSFDTGSSLRMQSQDLKVTLPF